MRKMTLMIIVGMAALLTLAFYWGAASAQTYSGASTIGVATAGPFSLVRHGFHFRGGWTGWGWEAPYGYGSGYYDYPNYGTRTEPGQTCVWNGYEWKCHKFDKKYYDNYY